MIESRVLLQSLHLKHFLCHSHPLDSIISAAKTAPPQRGQPWPGGALIEAVSATVVFGAWVSLQNEYQGKGLGVNTDDLRCSKESQAYVPLPFKISSVAHQTKRWYARMTIATWTIFNGIAPWKVVRITLEIKIIWRKTWNTEQLNYDNTLKVFGVRTQHLLGLYIETVKQWWYINLIKTSNVENGFC